MKATTPTEDCPMDGPSSRPSSRRSSISLDPESHHSHYHYNNGAAALHQNTHPDNAPAKGYYPQDTPSNPYQDRHSNGHSPRSSQYHHQPGPNTPSPPLPSSADVFQGRPLPPIEPSHPLHSYMSNSRRGSIADPEYHAAGDPHRRHSTAAAAAEASGYYGPPAGNTGPGGFGANDGRHYPSSSPSSTPSTPSEPQYHSHAPNSPLHLRQQQQQDHASGRRESLPSIHSSAGPLGQLLAQEPQRRHSIAHGTDPIGNNQYEHHPQHPNMGPLKRKTSGTPLSQVHSSNALDHPAKRRDSIPDAALGLHPYPSRSSYSAPSSPPRRGSIASNHGAVVPTLNLQPAAEIKLPTHGPHGPSAIEYGRPHFPLHQPRRPSLLSSEAGSRRSSIADVLHPHGPMPPHHHSPYPQQDYDQRMNMDMEKMHLSSNHNGSSESLQPQPQPQQQQDEEDEEYLQHHKGQGGGSAPLANTHLYPGYSTTYSSADGSGLLLKGETPYSRSPELRVSHKLAERKRRKEMKELFDELRDSLPVDRSLKTSKWEILSKAVDFIASMKVDQDELSKEVEALRQEVARLKQ